MTPDPSPPLVESPEYQAFRRFIQLTIVKREINEQLREIEPQLRALEPVLLGYLGENGYQMIKIDGFTLSPKREPWVYPAQGVSRASVCEALKLSGLGRLVQEGYSTRSLTSYIRELEDHHNLLTGSHPDALRELVPAPLAHVLEIRPGFKLQVLDRRTPKPPIEDSEGDYETD